MEKEISPKSTKPELLKAYNELIKKIQSEGKESIKQTKEVEEKKETVKSASSNSLEKIIKGVSELKLNISNALDSIEESMAQEYKKLAQLQEAIKIETKNLEEFYQIKVNIDSLEALILAQKEQKQRFEEEMLGIKQSWEKEKKEKELAMKEQENLLKKQKEREEEEYHYTLQLKRKKDQDAYQEKMTALEKEIILKRTSFEKDFAEREKNIAEKEQLLAELKQKVESFPADLEKAVKQAEKVISEKLTAQYKFESQLNESETEGERKLKDQIITSLEEKIKERDLLIIQLTQKADSLNAQVNDIAKKALESTANIRYIAREEKRKDENSGS